MMTNQEAIEFLKNIIDRESIGFVAPSCEGDVAIWQYHVEALQMAIKALELATNLQPNLQPCNQDCISRQAAIKMCREPRMRNADCSDFEMEIMMLPSAQPETHEERTETHACDCISRKAAIDEIKALYEWHDTVTEDRTIDHLKRLSSAQPERLTDDDFETIRIHLNAQKEKLCNQQRWEEADEYQRIIDRFMAFASAQPEHTNNLIKSDMISKQKVKYKLTALVNEIEEIFANIREREVDDSVCGLCEYDGAYIGQSGDWCNGCPGFEKDDCFKLKEKYRKEWTDING